MIVNTSVSSMSFVTSLMIVFVMFLTAPALRRRGENEDSFCQQVSRHKGSEVEQIYRHLIAYHPYNRTQLQK